MKNFLLIFGLFCATCSSCKKEEPFVNPDCVNDPVPYAPIDFGPLMNQMEVMPATPNGDQFIVILEGLCGLRPYGEHNLDSGQAASYTVAEWSTFVNTAPGNVVCGAIASFSGTLMRESNPQLSWAILSFGEKDNHANTDGHVTNAIKIKQDSVIVYALADINHGSTMVWKNDPTKFFDVRLIMPHAVAGTLHQVAMLRKNTAPAWYLSQYNCVSRTYPAYDPELGFSIHESRRTEYPYYVRACPSFFNYIKYWKWNNRDFGQTWDPMLLSHGVTFDVDWSNPEHAVYGYACFRGLYGWSDEQTKNELWP